MKQAPIPKNEKERLISLHELGLLDTNPEERFDRITRVATKIFHTPISTLTLVDAQREWFKSCQGLPDREGDRAISFCGHALLADKIFVIPDTKKDVRFFDNPMVIGEPYIRFYAGVPIINADGQQIGVFCIKDRKPRVFSKNDEDILIELAAWAELEVNSRNLSLALAEQKKLQKRLIQRNEETEKLRAKEKAILESIGDGLVVVDKKEKIIEMNNTAGELLGLTPAECVGKQYNEIWLVKNKKGENISLNDRPIQITLATGKKIATTTTTPYFYVHKNGTAFPVAITVTPVILNNEIIGIVDVFRDITQDKEVDRAKSEFVSLASHQLRTPTTNIKWILEILLSEKNGQLSEKQKEYFNEVYRNNQRIITLVNTLLNVSRIELGIFTIAPESTDIINLIKEILEEFRLRIQVKNLDIKEAYAQNIPLMLIDPKLLRIVIQNIISNAIKYTPAEGRVGIEILSKQKGEDIGHRKIQKNSLVIIVSDTGCGIPKNQYDKIFTKLFRADNAKEKDTDGTGLGLYLAKLITDHTQSDIWFESELNHGTTFYLIIPIENGLA